jgi:hypothetical protein
MSYPARVPPYMTARPPKRHENAVTLWCHRCYVARASILVVTGSGSLALCSHHAYLHFPALQAAGYQVIYL